MIEKLFARRGGVLLVAGAVLGAAVAGPGLTIAQKAFNQSSADKRYIKRGDVVVAGRTKEVPIPKFVETTFTPIVTAKIRAPGAGTLQVVGSLSAKDDGGTPLDGKLQYRLAVGKTGLTTDPTSYELLLPETTSARQNGSVTGVFKVKRKGLLKVSLQALELGSGSSIHGRSVSMVFVPSKAAPKTGGGGGGDKS